MVQWNGRCLGHECVGQRVGQRFDLCVLILTRNTHHEQALAQALQNSGKTLDYLRTFTAVGFGAGGPDQIGSRALERHRLGMLRTMAHGRKRKHFGPGLEQEFSHFVAHRHVAQHGAQFDGVFDGQRFLLLHLLRHTYQLGRAVLFRQVLGQKFFELVVDQLEHAAPGFGILLDHLDDTADFRLQAASTDGRGIKTKGHRAHAVDELACRMIQVAEKLWFCQGHAQHGHLKTRKPDAHSRRDAVFGEDALEHQRHHFDDGLFAVGARLFLEFSRALAHRAGHLDHCGRAVIFNDGAQGAVVHIGLHPVRSQRMRQSRRCRRRLRKIEPTQRRRQQTPQLHHDPLCPLAGAQQGRGSDVKRAHGRA